MADITVQVSDVGLFLGEGGPQTGDGPVTPALPVANLDLASIKFNHQYRLHNPS